MRAGTCSSERAGGRSVSDLIDLNPFQMLKLARLGTTGAACSRLFSTTRIIRAEAVEEIARPQRRPVGGFRGG